MDEDNDVDIDSDFDDDDDYGSEQMSASVANMTESERRAHHNKLERQRRDQIKESFSSLRDVVPALSSDRAGKASSASRAKILQAATEYIQQMTTRNSSVIRDIGDLKKQNKLLEQQVRIAERELSLKNHTSGSSPVQFQFNGFAQSNRSDSSDEDDDVDLTGGRGGLPGYSSAAGRVPPPRMTAAGDSQRPRKKIRPNNA